MNTKQDILRVVNALPNNDDPVVYLLWDKQDFAIEAMFIIDDGKHASEMAEDIDNVYDAVEALYPGLIFDSMAHIDDFDIVDNQAIQDAVRETYNEYYKNGNGTIRLTRMVR
jgi:hypothetical protein